MFVVRQMFLETKTFVVEYNMSFRSGFLLLGVFARYLAWLTSVAAILVSRTCLSASTERACIVFHYGADRNEPDTSFTDESFQSWLGEVVFFDD